MDSVIVVPERPAPVVVCGEAELLEQMDLIRYTGPTMVHWHEGRIKSVQIPNPLVIMVR